MAPPTNAIQLKGFTVLEAVVVLLAIVVVGNMLLTWGMVRRLKALQEQVAASGVPLDNGLRAGDEAPDFSAQSLAGDTVTRDEIVRDETVLAFLSPTCSGCETQLPALRELARQPGGRPAVVAVVDGVAEESTHLIEGMQGEVPILFAPRQHNDLLERYQVNVYPSFYVMGPEGRITGSHLSAKELLAPAQP